MSKDLSAVGKSLVKHASKTEFSAQRGAVAEMYPFLVEASARMSARAICRFLETEHDIKLSAVTINKALNDPQKYWNFFFDLIEPSARVFERGAWISLGAILFDDNKFNSVSGKLPARALLNNITNMGRAAYEDAQAAAFLREKWYSIKMEIRLKARPFIEHRLTKVQHSEKKG